MEWWASTLSGQHIQQGILKPVQVAETAAYYDTSSSIGIGVVIRGRCRVWRLLLEWQSDKCDIQWAEAVGLRHLLNVSSPRPISTSASGATTRVSLEGERRAGFTTSQSTTYSSGSLLTSADYAAQHTLHMSEVLSTLLTTHCAASTAAEAYYCLQYHFWKNPSASSLTLTSPVQAANSSGHWSAWHPSLLALQTCPI
jgi:hypothetical protein